MSRLHDCVRINRLGQIEREELSREDTARWLNHNQKMEPNWALMVDGVFYHWGQFVAAEIHVFETQYLMDAGKSLTRRPPPPLHLTYSK